MNEQDPSIGPTHRYDKPKPFQIAAGDSEHIEAISGHIEKWIGPVATVFHEIISDKVHIDVHVVAPTKDRPWYTLVTSGMSDLAMRPPDSHKDLAYSELFICLPADWKMTQDDLKSDQYYWPIHALKFLARFPHQYETWLWYGHTIPNGDPPAPINQHTNLCAFALLMPNLISSEFHELKIDAKKTIRFFALIPMHKDELEMKLRRGAEVFEKALIKAGFSELLNPGRPSVANRPGFFNRLFGKNG